MNYFSARFGVIRYTEHYNMNNNVSSPVDESKDLVFAKGEPDSGGRVFCPNCECEVRPFGHESRCRPTRGGTDRSSSTWDARRRRAWIGDTIHKLDVQLGALMTGINDRDLGRFFQNHTSAESQADYWRSLPDTSDLCVPPGTNDHAISTAFEASYKGRFRSDYLRSLFPSHWEAVIARATVRCP